MTGQLAHNHGVLTNQGAYGGYRAFKKGPQYGRGLSSWMQEAGYHTMFVGKYLNGYRHRDKTPPGWDEWHGAVRNVYGYYDFGLIDENGVETSYPGYMTDVYGDLTRETITESSKQDKPFFIWESNLAPHGACTVKPGVGCVWGPPKPARRHRDAFSRLSINEVGHDAFNERVVSDKPAHIRQSPRWSAARVAKKTRYHRARARSLKAVDESLRKTVRTLAGLGELDNTLIIFTSDNGYLMGQHRWQGKVLPYEPSLRIPMLMRGPGVAEGEKRSQTVALVDVAPTIAAAGGVRPALDVDGRSLLQLAAPQATEAGYGALSIEAGPLKEKDWPTWFYRGVRTGRYTYVRYPGLRERELYDRRRDPDQTTNVAYRPAYRATRKALAAKLRRLQDCVGSACYEVDGGGVPRPEREPHLASGATVHPDELGSIGRARQVVTITGRSWRTGRGKLTAWVRHRRTWTIARGPVRVRLGADGLAPEARTRHLDGETPAGTFRPAQAYGLGPRPRTAVPYRRVDGDDYWVFDRRAPRTYNLNQTTRSPSAEWRRTHAQRWAEHRSRFRHALVLDHNLPGKVTYARRFGELRAGAPADTRQGSFLLHGGKRLGRHGWTSMSGRQLTWLLRWMRPDTHRTRLVVGTPGYLRNRL